MTWTRRGGFSGIFIGDYGLKPDDMEMTCDGLAGDFAHVRWSAYQTQDPCTDLVAHRLRTCCTT